MKSEIFVVSHKKVKFPKDSFYKPIIVGKKNFPIEKDYERDDRKKNIAKKNANYCELTALYYIWKNKTNLDIIGMCHYRRYLMKKVKSDFSSLLTKEEVEHVLKVYDIILPQKRHFYRINVKEQYYSESKAFLKDYEVLEEVIKEKYPEYYEAFVKVSNSHSTYLYNVFIMTRKRLNEYCTFLFNILFEVEKRVDLAGYTKEQQRIFGFLSERLMTVYVLKNNLKVKEYKIVNIENKKNKEKMIILKNNIKKIRNKIRGE